jgi:hypothetical protein
MKKPSRLATGLALSSSLFAAAVAFATVGPQQAPAAISHSESPNAHAVAVTAPPLFATTAVSRLVRQAAAEARATTRSSAG